MLPSSATIGECNCSCSKRKSPNNGGSSSSSSSTTLSSSSSTPNNVSHLQQTPRSNKTIEDVWKDINLTSLTDHNTTTTSKTFQGFLATPLNFTIAVDPPTTSIVSSSSSSSLHSPVTALTLGSHSEFHFDPRKHNDLKLPQPHHDLAPKVGPFGNPFQNWAHSCNSYVHNRVVESDGNLRDMRNKRMMKNRESAARSRARQKENIAYTFELQQKVQQLLEENARLRRQQQRLFDTAANQQQERLNHNLYRTLSAPF